MNNLFQFGWVSSQINGNYAAWSTNWAVGNEEDADDFFYNTSPEPGEVFFCLPFEEEEIDRTPPPPLPEGYKKRR